jgi:outer membrane protein OmpA-like peptidoglycan-associated protein/opacity protein-like surface antigen
VKRAFYPFVVFSLATFFLLTFSLFATAAEPLNATKEPVEIYHPFYLGVFGGFVVPDDLIVENGGREEIQLNNSWTAGAKAGVIFPFKWIAAELEYSYFDNQNVENNGGSGGSGGAGHYKANNVMANLMLRYPHGMIRPYIGGGAGWSWAEFSQGGANDETPNAFAWQGLAGINLEIIPSLSVDFGFRFFQSKYKVNEGLGDINASVTDHIFLAGLNYHFGGSKPLPPPPPVVEEPLPPPPPPPPPPVKVKKCPDTPPGCVVDEEGCPIDSDMDGVCDGLDKCPDTPRGCIVDKDGCPIDSDMDGVIDCLDKCPGTPAGVKVDKDGCPIPEIIEKGRTTLKVLFDFDKSVIKTGYYGDVDNLISVMKQYPDLNVVIEGHTDNHGTAAYNKKLSQRRADAVKKYMVEKGGIDSNRLTTQGYGFERPITSNKTSEGRAKNRRVEAVADYIIKK